MNEKPAAIITIATRKTITIQIQHEFIDKYEKYRAYAALSFKTQNRSRSLTVALSLSLSIVNKMNSPQLVNTAAQAHHNSSSGASATNNNNSQTQATSANKFAPARRLAARQTLRLAIPKQQGDSVTLPHAHAQTSSIYRHSPSQLPPAPLLKRHTSTASAAGNCSGGNNSFIPKSASPLESHKLPNVTPTCNANPLLYNGNGSASSIASNSSFLGVRKPSLTLNSSDIRNNNDLFAFAKDMSPALELSGKSQSYTLNGICISIKYTLLHRSLALALTNVHRYNHCHIASK